MKLIKRRLTNGWYHCHCKTCGFVMAVAKLDEFICSCPVNKMATSSEQTKTVSEDVENLEQKAEVPAEVKPVEESVKPKRRRRRTTKKKTEEKPAE